LLIKSWDLWISVSHMQREEFGLDKGRFWAPGADITSWSASWNDLTAALWEATIALDLMSLGGFPFFTQRRNDSHDGWGLFPTSKRAISNPF
jgi:hypothetical protein